MRAAVVPWVCSRFFSPRFLEFFPVVLSTDDSGTTVIVRVSCVGRVAKGGEGGNGNPTLK